MGFRHSGNMNYTLITGASSGIGKALSIRCAAEGYNLILVGRDQVALQELASLLKEKHAISAEPLTVDLLSPGAAEYVYKQCRKNNWAVRILINNAALAQWGPFEELSLDHMQEVMTLNQQVLVSLCHYFAPMLKEVPFAHILNVACTAAFQPIPFLSVYAASKSFVLSFSQSLRYELKEKQINVSCLCPGPTDTAFFEKIGFQDISRSRGAIMKTEEVADTAIAGLIRKEAVIVPGFSNQIGAGFSRYFPKKWMVGMIGKFFRPK